MTSMLSNDHGPVGRKLRPRSTHLLAVLAIALVVLGCGAEDTSTVDRSEDARWLIALTSDTASYTSGTLVLRGVTDEATMFTDAPVRRVSNIATSKLPRIWKGLGFEATSPNAAVTWVEDGEPREAIVVLSEPKFTGERLSFAAANEGKAPSVSMQDVSLVIDDSTNDRGSAFMEPCTSFEFVKSGSLSSFDGDLYASGITCAEAIDALNAIDAQLFSSTPGKASGTFNVSADNNTFDCTYTSTYSDTDRSGITLDCGSGSSKSPGFHFDGSGWPS